MKVIIAGCRDFNNYQYAKDKISILLSNYTKDQLEIISGGASGADALGERFANEFGIKVTRFNADWNKHGKKAGPIRNRQMGEYSDVLIAFWDFSSPGTKNMIELMKKYNKPYRIIDIRNK